MEFVVEGVSVSWGPGMAGEGASRYFKRFLSGGEAGESRGEWWAGRVCVAGVLRRMRRDRWGVSWE